MGLVYADRVLETTTTTGTGTLTLAGAVTGYQTFSAIGNANTCYIAIWGVDGNGTPTGQWEVTGPETYTASGTTITRSALLASSTGSLINFSAGTKYVGVVTPATLFSSTGSGSIVRATSPTLVTPLLGTPTSGNLTNCTGVATAVSNSDGTLTISPTTGAVVASIALGHANTWTTNQTFTPASGSAIGLTVKGAASPQTGDYLDVVDFSTGQKVLSIIGTNGGSGVYGAMLSFFRSDTGQLQGRIGWLNNSAGIQFDSNPQASWQFQDGVQIGNSHGLNAEGPIQGSYFAPHSSVDVSFYRSAAGTWTVGTGAASGIASLICGNATTSTIGLTVKGIASRTAQLAQFQTSAGGSLGNVSGGCIADVVADTATTHTDGTFDQLFTVTTVANALIVNGDKIEFDFTLSVVGHAIATNQIQILFAGITIFDSGANNFAVSGTIRIIGQIIRATSTTCRAIVSFLPAGSTTILAFEKMTYTPEATLTGLTLTGTNILKLQAAAASTNAAASDITINMGSVDIVGFGA